jgi:hypothetical protein
MLNAMVETLNHTSTSTSTNNLNPQLHDDYLAQTIPRDHDHDYTSTLEDQDDEEQPPIPPPKDYIESSRRAFGITSISSSSLDRTCGLPEGMDVREALAQCEDPALGWSLQFWATIADPVVSLVLIFHSCLILVQHRRSIDAPLLYICNDIADVSDGPCILRLPCDWYVLSHIFNVMFPTCLTFRNM